MAGDLAILMLRRATPFHLTCLTKRRFSGAQPGAQLRVEISAEAQLWITVTSMADTPSEAPEAELIARAREGDCHAFRELLRRARAPMVSAIRSLTRDVTAAEDLLRESEIRLWRALKRIRGDAAWATFAWQVARNRARNWIRDEANRRRLLAQHGNVDLDDVMAQPPTDPERAAIVRQSADKVIRAMKALPEGDRELVTQHIDNDPQDPEVISRGALSATQRSRLFRARGKMRADVEGSGRGKS
jgi:RNA polymerase sigma-70 factor, ECF subfamily